MNLTIQILTHNNSSTIEKCLESIQDLDCEIIVADLESTDDTLEKVKNYNCSIRKIKWNKNFSEIRNNISKTKWNMYIQPEEHLYHGKEIIESIINSDEKMAKCLVLQSGLLTKEIRLWNKDYGKFVRPVYENIEPDLSINTEILIFNEKQKTSKLEEEALSNWLTSYPTSEDIYYYLACYNLTKGNNKEFLKNAEYFLFRAENTNEVTTMIRYYSSLVYFRNKNLNESLRNVLYCLSYYPLMAEFWCLLGDIFLTLDQKQRAKAFYQNAIVMGSRRPKDDNMPIEVIKYKEYPEKILNEI